MATHDLWNRDVALWRHWSDDVQGGPLDAGHFFPKELPGATAAALSKFLS